MLDVAVQLEYNTRRTLVVLRLSYSCRALLLLTELVILLQALCAQQRIMRTTAHAGCAPWNGVGGFKHVGVCRLPHRCMVHFHTIHRLV